MAATLPAINSAGYRVSQGPAVQQHEPSVPSAGKPTQITTITLTKKRSQGRKERELEQKQQELRAQQPFLNKVETAQYRNTYKHTLCLDILQEGYHKSFAELFKLIKQQNEEREKAGPESTLWNQVLLENEPDKLDTLKLYLTEAESAQRQDDFAQVYQCQYRLACYFQESGDKWLADHFFASCLATSANVKGDEGRMAAQGHCNVGLSLEEGGDYFTAADNFELFYQLSKDKSDWVSKEDGKTYYFQSCTHLTRIYTTIAEEMEREGNLEKYLQFLKKAYDMGKEGGDKKQEGEASYRLGIAYEKNGDSQTALVHLNFYLDTCRSMGDNFGQGKACEAIAKSYDSQGKVEESIKYLEMFVEVAEKSENNKAISQACSDLGAMFNSLGRYEQAVDYFNKSYNIARSMNDTETISSSRVLFGVAAGHKMLFNFAGHVELANRPCMERLIEWKDNRGDEFDKAVPEVVAETPDINKEEEKREEEKSEAAEETNSQEEQAEEDTKEEKPESEPDEKQE